MTSPNKGTLTGLRRMDKTKRVRLNFDSAGGRRSRMVAQDTLPLSDHRATCPGLPSFFE